MSIGSINFGANALSQMQHLYAARGQRDGGSPDGDQSGATATQAPRGAGISSGNSGIAQLVSDMQAFLTQYAAQGGNLSGNGSGNVSQAPTGILPATPPTASSPAATTLPAGTPAATSSPQGTSATLTSGLQSILSDLGSLFAPQGTRDRGSLFGSVNGMNAASGGSDNDGDGSSQVASGTQSASASSSGWTPSTMGASAPASPALALGQLLRAFQTSQTQYGFGMNQGGTSVLA